MTTSPFIGIHQQIKTGTNPQTFVGDLVLVSDHMSGYRDAHRSRYMCEVPKNTFLMIIKAQSFSETLSRRATASFEVLYRDQAVWVDASHLVKVTPNDTLGGKTFVITGSLMYTRDIYKSVIECCGGKFSNTLSKSTDYLICGENVGATKMNKAKTYGTKMLTEKAFNAMVVV
jgi:NAD-dependent DNA ligase